MLKLQYIHQPIDNGITIPHIVTCDDNKKYVLKFPGNPETERALVNELVCYELASLLELPIPSFSLVSIKMTDYNGNVSKDIKKKEGIGFATLYLNKIAPVLNTSNILKTNNKEDALKILIFDILIHNKDRNQGNLLVDFREKKLIMIDHTHAFNLGPVWDEYQLRRLIGNEFTFADLNQFNYNNLIQTKSSLDFDMSKITCYYKKIKALKQHDIRSIISSVPNSWNVSIVESDLLLEYLWDRIKRIDEIFSLLKI